MRIWTGERDSPQPAVRALHSASSARAACIWSGCGIRAERSSIVHPSLKRFLEDTPAALELQDLKFGPFCGNITLPKGEKSPAAACSAAGLFSGASALYGDVVFFQTLIEGRAGDVQHAGGGGQIPMLFPQDVQQGLPRLRLLRMDVDVRGKGAVARAGEKRSRQRSPNAG